MTELNERFIRLFEELFQEVNRRANRPTSHAFELSEAARRDHAINRNSARLGYIRDVRNTLQHPRHKGEGPAILVSEAFLREVEGILNHLKHPPTANSVGVPRGQIRTADPNETLGALAAEMHSRGFSHLPILDAKGVVTGVFNEAAVFRRFLAQGEVILSKEMPLREIMEDCGLHDDRTETFRFVRPGTPLDDLVDVLRVPDRPASRVGAIFVTASGKPTEPLTRLITPWDVLTGERG